MPYRTRHGQLEKVMPPTKQDVHELRFHVIAKMTVRYERASDGTFSVVDSMLEHSRVATHPDDNPTKEQLAMLMENADALLELTGVGLTEQQHRKRNPLVVPSTGNAADKKDGPL